MTVRSRVALGIALLAAVAGVVFLVVGGAPEVEEVWRTDHGVELRREPGGAALDDYVLLPCSDPSGKRLDFVVRNSLRDRALAWFGGAALHRLEETASVVDVGGERWRRFVVNAKGLTTEEAMDSVGK